MKNLIGISGKIGSGKDTIGKIIQYLIWENSIPEYKYEGKLEDLLSNPNMIFVPKGVRGFVSVSNESEFRIKKFADKLKDIVCILLDCTRKQLEDREFKEKELGEEWWYYKYEVGGLKMLPYLGYKNENHRHTFLIKLTPRLLLQLLGTDCGREIIHPNIWCNSLFSDYKSKEVVSENAPSSSSYENKNEWKIDWVREEYPLWIITDTRFNNEAKTIKDRGGLMIKVVRPLEKQHFITTIPLHTEPTGFNYHNFQSVWFFGDNSKLVYHYHNGKTTKYIDLPNEINRVTSEIANIYKKDENYFVDIKTYMNLHESETALDNYKDWDYVIQNDGSIEDLIEKVKQILIKEKLL